MKEFLRLMLIIILMLNFTTLFCQDLGKHRWKDRVIIIQTPDTNNQLYASQKTEFIGAEEELAERKLVIYEQQDPSKPFKIKLIGLDGGTKLVQTEVLKKEELFRVIDAMPMRMQEMREKQK